MPRKVKIAKPVHCDLNLTSMMDVLFTILVFFVMTTNLARESLPPLEIPEPANSVATEPDRNIVRVTVNMFADPEQSGKCKDIRYGAEALGPVSGTSLSALGEKLLKEKAIHPEVRVDLRVEKSIRYSEVQPIMKVITGAAIPKINVVARKAGLDAAAGK